MGAGHDDTPLDTPLDTDIVDALETWATRHEHPDEPIWTVGDRSYTPASFTRAATQDPTSAAAAYLRRALGAGLTIDEIIEALTR